MPPKTPKQSFSSWREKKFVIPKIARKDSPSFFQEYFYYILVATTLGLMLLLKGGGMKGSDAIVIGMWFGAIMWFARQTQAYFKEKKKTADDERAAKQPKMKPFGENWEPPKGMKPMIGPQWPLSPGASGTESTDATSAEEKKNKPGFVYERPTLPGRTPKLPANWGSKGKKKPKQ
jgi:hypothetical protein